MDWSLIFSVMLFVLSLISATLEYFAASIPFLNVFSMLITSSSGFLSVVCLIAVIAAFLKHREDKRLAVLPVVFYVLDFVIINKLYLNKTWPALIARIQKILRAIGNWNWPVILVTTFCLAVAIGMLAWGILIWKKRGVKGIHHTVARNEDNTTAAKSEDKTAATSYEPECDQDEGWASCGADSPPTFPKEENTPPDTSSLARSLGCILLIIPAISFIQFVFYQVLPLGLNVPEALSNVFDILSYIATISLGIAVALLLWSAKKKILNGKPRSPAVLAFILELILFVIFFFKADAINEDFLNSFLNNITNNVIAALVVIPIVLFVILDIAISLVLNLFSEGTDGDSNSWKKEAQDKLNKIQRRIVMFSLNIFLGILNLFLFIPDFFNEVGDLLLSKRNLFPEFKEEEDKAPTPTDPPENQAHQSGCKRD